MEDRRLSNLLVLRERVLPSTSESIMVNDVIPLLVSIKRDLEEIKTRLAKIEKRLGLME